MKTIIIEHRSTPETPSAEGKVGFGYHDRYSVLEDNKILQHDWCSCCPNAWKPSTGLWWDFAYGWLAKGNYPFEVVTHNKYGKCILVNKGESCAAKNRNANHGGKRILTEVFIHKGNANGWRGSGGCITISSVIWQSFIDLFTNREQGILMINDQTGIHYT